MSVIDGIMEKIIEEADLSVGKRTAVIYFKNIGDFYALCSSIRYAEEQLDQRFIILYTSERHKEIASWFSYDDYHIELFYLPEEEWTLLRKNESSPEVIEKYKGLIYTWHSKDTMFTKWTKHTDPQFNEHVRMPRTPKYDLSFFKDKYGIIEKKTVIINPVSTSVSSPPDYFWNFSADIFEMMGYKVLFNADEKNRKRFSRECILPPVQEMVSLLDHCGMFFTVRCGLLDMVSSTTAKIVVFSSSFFKSIDKVYGLSNEDGRIKTYFYNDDDYFFEKTDFISKVFSYYDEQRKDLKEIIHNISSVELCERSTEPSFLIPQHIDTYKPIKDHNKLRERYPTEPFLDIKYYYKITDDKKIYFNLVGFDSDLYRIDLNVLIGEVTKYRLNDYADGSLLFKPDKTGDYRVKVILYDKKTYKHQHFETVSLSYWVKPPENVRSLSLCNDLSAYISGLSRYKKDMIIIMSTKDTHTHNIIKKIITDLGNIKILGLQKDLINTYRFSYAAVIDSGNVVFEEISDQKEISLKTDIDGVNICLRSVGWNVNKSSKEPIQISVNGQECSVNRRGLNITVWDKTDNELIDSVCFDIFDKEKVIRKKVCKSNSLRSI